MEIENLSNPLFTLTIKEYIELTKQIYREISGELSSNSIMPFRNEGKEILLTQEAADFLNITKSTLYKLNFERKIPYMKRGKRVYYKRAEIIEWLNEGRVKTNDEIEAANFLLTRKGSRKN